ncbi:MAG: hypothetical protein WA896_19930 [Spirulinaceae cyanobacterium]
MTLLTDSHLPETNPEEQQIYDHLLNCVKEESPSEIVERFRLLFIEATGYPDAKVRDAIAKIVNAKYAEKKFKYILNRCCHIVINRWQIEAEQEAISELLHLLENASAPKSAYSRTARRMYTLVKGFLETDQYTTLHRLANVVGKKLEITVGKPHPVGHLINRYPYLYKHCLLSEDSSYEHQQTVMSIQASKQKNFEFSLSQYVTYQLRLAQMARMGQLNKGAKPNIQPVRNPTLLTEQELAIALKHFVGKVQGDYTYRDLAHSFMKHTKDARSYRDFKDNLYEYLTFPINPRYGNTQFNERLYKQLQSTLPHSDFQKPNESLILRTSTQLLNFLIVESAYQPNHYVFVDLISNLGATPTVALLLKITLACHKVRPHLEKRFSILFNHYESSNKDGVPWLIQSLENVNIAFSIHFGAVDLSCLKQLMK